MYQLQTPVARKRLGCAHIPTTAPRPGAREVSMGKFVEKSYRGKLRTLVTYSALARPEPVLGYTGSWLTSGYEAPWGPSPTVRCLSVGRVAKAQPGHQGARESPARPPVQEQFLDHHHGLDLFYVLLTRSPLASKLSY